MHLGGVVERQRVHGPVARRQAEGGDRADVLVDQGPVRHHRALGEGRGPGGVEQLHQVAGAGGPLRGEGPLGPQGVQERARSVAQSSYGAAGGDPVREVRVGEDEGGSRLVQEIGQVVAGEVLVDRYVDEPGPRAGEEGDQIGVRVVGVRGHPVAGVQVVIPRQDSGRGGDRRVQGPVAPDPVAVPYGGPFRGAAGAAGEDAVDCAAAYTGHGVILCGRARRVKGPSGSVGTGAGMSGQERGVSGRRAASGACQGEAGVCRAAGYRPDG